MANLTIDEIKKALTENGIPLPSGRQNKEKYVKLFEENITLNSSVGDTFSSDDESSQNSRKVTSSSTTTKQNGEITVENIVDLSNDELFERLLSLGFTPGPVLATTRKVYEKKLLKLLNGEPVEKSNESFQVDENEISDNEITIGQNSGRRIRASPKPSTSVLDAAASGDARKTYEPKPVASKRISYIEVVPRNSSSRRIEDVGGPTFIRQRPVESPDHYVGRWSPKTSREPVRERASTTKKVTVYLGVLAVLVVIAAFVYYQWSAHDPYKQIEDDAENEMLQFTGRKQT